jgi:hypothetical protein
VHATHPHPRRALAVTAGALVLTVAALALPASVDRIETPFGGGGASDPASTSVSAAPYVPERPAWIHDPLRSPLRDLQAPPAAATAASAR